MIKKLTPAQALERLERTCAKSEISTAEAHMRLRRWGIADADAGKIVESLQKNRFIDDARFARALVRDRLRFSRWGRLKIRAALSQAGIRGQMADEALAEIDPGQYTGTLTDLLAHKSQSLDPALPPFERRNRLVRFAASRGFETSMSAQIAATLLKHKTEN